MMADMIALILTGLLRVARPSALWCSRTSRCGTNWSSSSAPGRVHGCEPPTGCSIWVLLSRLLAGAGERRLLGVLASS
jgi:hypothetical protein